MLPTQQPTEHPTAGHRCTTPPGLARRLVAPVAMAAGAGSVCAAIWFADPTTPGGLIPPCPTRTLLGIDCPGCGTCRMLYSLLHGDLPAALHYNALALVAVIVLVVTFVLWTRNRILGRAHRSWTTLRFAPIVTLVIVGIWFVIRNIPVAPFTGLYV
ncbi:membrane protein [Mycolicibacterium insubricum]|jgi:hypothetical protein|nr:DUF2752 domain-containing protein [Mycolicibacterium sp.]MCV7080442.1 DUF2752 domain-containing protein [Mycolicibacterium insubricum]BBZ68251.1 membrane protein [Mycolicibacterium insubricum]